MMEPFWHSRLGETKIFTPPKFVIIDDDLDHAKSIAECIQGLGSSCATVIHTTESDPPKELFLGVRVIFMDLQLINKSLGNFNSHYGEIQRILTHVVNPSGGPFLLVLWTDRPEKAEGLEEYLRSNMYARAPYAKPAKICALSKIKFMLGTPKAAENLKEALQKEIAESPSIAALMHWEAEIALAADRVLTGIVDISKDRDSDLGSVLKLLANETTGTGAAASSPRRALHQAFLPLLSDQINFAAEMPDSSPTFWSKAYADAPSQAASRSQAATLNTRLHLRTAGNDKSVSPLSWGAICELETDFAWEDFGVEARDHLNCGEVFISDYVTKKVSLNWMAPKSTEVVYGPQPEKYPGMRILQIRIDAACDYAQYSGGPIPYVLATFIPVSPPGANGNEKATKLVSGATAWLSPVLNLPGLGLGYLLVDPRFSRVKGKNQAGLFKAIAYIKEQLLAQLIISIANHGARPGITRIVG